jgi:hypothetical protein
MNVEMFLNTYTFLAEPIILHVVTLDCVELC